MKKVVIMWTSKTENGCYFGCSVEVKGFFVKYTVQCTEEIFETLDKGMEIEVPIGALKN